MAPGGLRAAAVEESSPILLLLQKRSSALPTTGLRPAERVSNPVGEDTIVGDSGPIPIKDEAGGWSTVFWKVSMVLG